MSPEIIALLAQIPSVGIFIYFVLTTRKEDREERAEQARLEREARSDESKKWREFLRIQQDAFTKVLASNTEALRDLGVDVEGHHKQVSSAITRMMERTAIADQK